MFVISVTIYEIKVKTSFQSINRLTAFFYTFTLKLQIIMTLKNKTKIQYKTL
jgi:hypothetical protein